MEKKTSDNQLFDFWRKFSKAPYHFHMDLDTWNNSMYFDTDNDGHKLFSRLETKVIRSAPDQSGAVTGLIQYGQTAFGFDRNGELSDAVHHPVIRMLCFDPDSPEIGQELLNCAVSDLGAEQKIYCFETDLL